MLNLNEINSLNPWTAIVHTLLTRSNITISKIPQLVSNSTKVAPSQPTEHFMKSIIFLMLMTLSAQLFAATDPGSCKIKVVSVGEEPRDLRPFWQRDRDYKSYEQHATELLLDKGYELVDDSSPEYNGERVLVLSFYFSVIEQDSSPQQNLFSYSSRKEKIKQQYEEFKAVVKDIWSEPETHANLSITPFEGITEFSFQRMKERMNVGTVVVGKKAKVFTKRDLKAIDKLIDLLPDCR